ncbi:MAG: winged helix-turn-helix transcriptional regulator [Euryarchaeota archaeon]|nr:winged helix-turn-helix transcriptional regulator [Euryarchaeota archaeon]
MKIKKPATENERVLATFLLVFIVYFGLDSLASLLLTEESLSLLRYRLTLSFIAGIAAGALFYMWAKPEEEKKQDSKSYAILERALSEDEALLIEIIRENEGITQDSLRFRTGFSKSKVSALLLNLEKKGIITRERLGRTYKVFIADWIKK